MAQVTTAEVTGLSPATVSAIVRQLSLDGVVSVAPGTSHGRRARIISLRTGGGVLAGVALSRRRLHLIIGGADGRVLAEEVHALRCPALSPSWLDALAAMVSAASNRAAPARELLRAAVSMPEPACGGGRGPAPEVEAGLAERLGVPVMADRAARLELLGELAAGAARGPRDVVYLRTDPAIEAAMLVDGRLVYGADGRAGTIAHLRWGQDDVACACGSRGCLEAAVGARALADRLGAVPGQQLSARQVINAALAGDVDCGQAIMDAARHLGRVVGVLCVLNPQAILLAGELPAADGLFMAPLLESATGHLGAAGRLPAARRSHLGDRAAPVGALRAAVTAAGFAFEK